MTIEEIKEMVEKREKELSVPYEMDDSYQYCRDFLLHNPVSNMTDFLKIDIWSCVKCDCFLRSNGDEIASISSMIDSFSSYIDSLSYAQYSKLINFLFFISDFDNVDEIVCILDASQIKSFFKLVQLEFDEANGFENLDIGSELELKKGILSLKKMQKNGNISSLLRFISSHVEVSARVLSFVAAYKKIKEDSHKLSLAADYYSISNKKERERMFQKFYREFYNPKSILGEYYFISGEVCREERRLQQRRREAEREIRVNRRALESLEKASHDDEILNAREILRGVKNERIKKAISMYIYEHNLKGYQSLQEEFESLSIDEVNHYLALFSKYHLEIDREEVSRFMNYSLENLEIILDFLVKANLFSFLSSILLLSSLDVILSMKKYVEDGYFDVSFLRENVSIFYLDSKVNSNFYENLKIFDSFHINPLSFYPFPYVFLIDSSILQKNLEILDKYGLRKGFKNADDYHFLMCDHLAEKIDFFIELGYGSFLEEDLSLVMEENVTRLSLLKDMNLLPEEVDDLYDVLERDKFFVPDDRILDYVQEFSNMIPKELFEGIDLSSFQKDKWTYSIGGVLFSVFKVLRMREEGFSFYDALLFGKKINHQELDRIVHTLKPCCEKEKRI